jgi:hypothetical protein
MVLICLAEVSMIAALATDAAQQVLPFRRTDF